MPAEGGSCDTAKGSFILMIARRSFRTLFLLYPSMVPVSTALWRYFDSGHTVRPTYRCALRWVGCSFLGEVGLRKILHDIL